MLLTRVDDSKLITYEWGSCTVHSIGKSPLQGVQQLSSRISHFTIKWIWIPIDLKPVILGEFKTPKGKIKNKIICSHFVLQII